MKLLSNQRLNRRERDFSNKTEKKSSKMYRVTLDSINREIRYSSRK